MGGLVKLNTLAELDIRLLQRAGFFDNNRYVPLSIKHRLPFHLTRNDAGNVISVELVYHKKYYSSTIDVAYSDGKFGRRAFFKCQFSGLKCKTLYFHQGVFKARSAIPELSVRNGSPTQRKYAKAASDRSRLVGTDGRGPARGKKRRDILDSLSKDEWARTELSDLADQEFRLTRAHMNKVLRKSSTLKTGPWSTAAAIRSAEEVPSSLIDSRMELPSIHDGLPNPVLSRGDIGNFPVVDLSTLMGFMKQRNWKTSLFNLSWNYEGKDQCYYALVDTRRASICGTEIGHRASSGDLDARWRARIWWTTSGRARFICPYTGARVDSLFIREGVLGSRKALNLHYLRRGKEGVLGPQIKRGKRAPQKFLKQESDASVDARAQEALRAARLKVKLGSDLLRRALEGHFPSMRAILISLRWGEEFHGIPELMSEEERSLFLQELAAAKSAGGHAG